MKTWVVAVPLDCRRIYTTAKLGLDLSKNWSRPDNFLGSCMPYCCFVPLIIRVKQGKKQEEKETVLQPNVLLFLLNIHELNSTKFPYSAMCHTLST